MPAIQQVAFGETQEGQGVVVFMGAKQQPKKMAQFIKVCQGVLPVLVVTTSLGLGVTHINEGDRDDLYCEAGDYLTGGKGMKMLESPIEIQP